MACVRFRALVRRAASTWLTMGMKKQRDFPGSRAGGHHEALALCGERDRLLLVLVEGQRLTVRAEDVGAARMENAIRNQGADVRRALVARVDLDERFGPVAVLSGRCP